MSIVLNTAFSLFETEFKKVIKYSFLPKDSKDSLKMLKNALNESKDEIEYRNSKTPNYYRSGVISALANIIHEITIRMKDFGIVEKMYKRVRYHERFSSIGDLFEVAHECVNEIVTYRQETIDMDFNNRLADVDNLINDVKGLASESSIPAQPKRAKTPSPAPAPKPKTPSPKQNNKTARCPRGTRRNKKTGNCESTTGRAPVATVVDAVVPATQKMKRCPRGSRRNKKTGNCDKN